MSIFGFYAEVNLGCVCVLMLLFYSIKKLPTPLLKYPLFQKLVLWHIIYFISDSMWAFVNDGVLPKNTFSVLLVNYSNIVILPVVAYSCFLFAEISTRPDMTRKQIEHLQVKLLIPIIAQALILLVSFIVAPDFWLDEKLEPCDFYYMLLAIMPMLYWMTATVRGVIRAHEVQNRPNLRTYLIVAARRCSLR